MDENLYDEVCVLRILLYPLCSDGISAHPTPRQESSPCASKMESIAAFTLLSVYCVNESTFLLKLFSLATTLVPSLMAEMAKTSIKVERYVLAFFPSVAEQGFDFFSPAFHRFVCFLLLIVRHMFSHILYFCIISTFRLTSGMSMTMLVPRRRGWQTLSLQETWLAPPTPMG